MTEAERKVLLDMLDETRRQIEDAPVSEMPIPPDLLDRFVPTKFDETNNALANTNLSSTKALIVKASPLTAYSAVIPRALELLLRVVALALV